eukprot:sb/3465431/
MWLVVEGVVMNQMINKGYKFTVPNQFIRFNAFTFGVSVFLALVGAAVLSAADSYINIPRDYCWLDGTALLAFMWIPIILLTIITLALLVKCYIELNKTSHKHKEIEVEVVKKTILGVLVLMILLDVGWIFAGVAGATTLDPSFTKIQEYCNVMFIVFNIFQGIAVLALFCVLNPKVMGAWKGIVEVEEEKDVERPPSPQVAVVDNSDMKSHRSAKSGRSMARSTKSGRSVGDILLMSAIAPLNDADEKVGDFDEGDKKKKKKKTGEEGEEKKKKKDKEGGGEEGEKKKKEKKPAGEEGAEEKKKKEKKPAGEEGEGEEKKKKKKKEGDTVAEEGAAEGEKKEKKKKEKTEGAMGEAGEEKPKKKKKTEGEDAGDGTKTEASVAKSKKKKKDKTET